MAYAYRYAPDAEPGTTQIWNRWQAETKVGKPALLAIEANAASAPTKTFTLRVMTGTLTVDAAAPEPPNGDGEPCGFCGLPIKPGEGRYLENPGQWKHELVTCRKALLAYVRELELQVAAAAKEARRGLWRQTDANEGTRLTYCAVHAVRWQREWGEPQCGFIQADREENDDAGDPG